MKAFRIVILAVFALSVAATIAVVFARMHELHVVHTVLSTLTFVLIAVYLEISSGIASLITLRELQARFALDASLNVVAPNSVIRCDGVITEGSSQVDESALSGVRELVTKSPGDRVYRGTINHGGTLTLEAIDALKVVADAVPLKKSDAFNVCAGALAKSGIYVKSPEVLLKLAKASTLAPLDNSPEREGFNVTREALRTMSITLSDSGSDVSIVLCDFRDFDDSAEIAITHNKITHVLKAVYIARVFARDLLYSKIAYTAALFTLIILVMCKQFMFIGLTVALLSMFDVLDVRRLDRKVAKLSFEKVTSTP
jgi:cation transport ATPase